MFKSAIFKLTIWYLISIVGLSVLFSVVVYNFATYEINEALNHQYLASIYSKNTKEKINYDYQSELSTRSNQLLDDLIYFNLVVLVMASFFSVVLARKTLKPIKESHDAQIRFTAEASHELRTPISSIKADTESVLMLKHPSNSLLSDTLKSNLDDLKKLELLTEHLLDIAKFQSSITDNFVTTNLEPIIKQVVKEFSQEIKSKRLSIESDISNASVMTDPLSIKLLISILIDNAIKYSNLDGQIVLKLYKSKKTVIIEIIDNGIGIDSEAIKHIFEPFYRSKNAKNSNLVNGFGLGLSLGKDIISCLKGDLKIINNPDNGVTAKVILF